MTLIEAINNPNMNVFDIWDDKKSNFGFDVYTYRKPNESDEDWHDRDTKNFEFALRLKKKKLNNK